MMLRFLLALLILLLPASASAERLAKVVEHAVEPLPARVAESELALDILYEPPNLEVEGGAADGGEVDSLGGASPGDRGQDLPDESVAPEGVTRDGPGPWPLIGAPIRDQDCRGGQVSADAYTVLAICRGTDPDAPGDDHVILRQGDAVLRYPAPLAAVDDFDVSLSPDGMRFAGSFKAGSSRAIHLVDLATRKARVLSGGWRDPGPPRLADTAASVAFTARVGGKPTAVQVVLGETREEDVAYRLWTGGEPLSVRGISGDGRKVLITSKEFDLVEAILLEGERGTRLGLSERKGDVSDAALHPNGNMAVFSSRVGGACAVFWVEVGRRSRKDFLGSVEHCYDRVGMEDSGRLVVHEGVRGKGRRGFVWDRKKDDARLILPNECSAPQITDDGLFISARCTGRAPGVGTWLFIVPPEESKK
jgi:hypothetical protein